MTDDAENEPISAAESALREHGKRGDDGRWWFSSPDCSHSEASALAIVEACLILDVPITDIVTSPVWLRLVDKLAKLEERVALLEGRPA